jgi:superfamily II DNA helicase RecQ
MADSLNEAGLLACSYHAGMPNRDRESAQNKWKENECQVALFTLLLQKVLRMVWCIGVA